ncbi:MAG: OmpH family outer membrane protein [Tropicimonas sp.]|uniref:OmpH family outer membrane protein n=1 Tax=Tropicimonas sp. TaxID=2067044 RepID=UPI003A8A359D
MLRHVQKAARPALVAAALFCAFEGRAQVLSSGAVQVLTLDQDRLYAETLFGRRLQAEIERASQVLAERNRDLSQALRDEEQALTERRKTISTQEFRVLADAFDEKVVKLREEQDARIAALQRQQEADRLAFNRRIIPILSELIRDSGAVAILDDRAVILSAESIDVTDRAIARIDEALGEGLGAESGGTTIPGDPPVPGATAQ